MILCVTLNPLVDTTFFVDEFRAVYRTNARRIAHVAGGKGNNVARALVCMGQPARAFTVLGGTAGRHLSDLLDADGAEKAVVWVSGETRVSVTMVDRDHEQRGYWAPAEPFLESDAAAVRERFPRALDGVQAMSMCGSSPHPMADSLYPELLRAAAGRGIPTLLDTYGEALRLGLKASSTVVKINRQEAAAWLGRPLDTLRQQVDGLGELLRTGPEWAVLTLGAGGALLAQGRQRWMARPPEAAVVNPISSGDAMTAGLMMGIVNGQPSQECFRLGMAMAVVNAMTWEVCRLTLEEVQAMLPRIELTPVEC